VASYCDSSALLKRFVDEAESDALRRYLAGKTVIASELALEEVLRGAQRLRVDLDASVFLAFHLVPIHREVLLRAIPLLPSGLRSLDAIHLSTALGLGDECDELLTYDRRMQEAAALAGLAVEAPGQEP
jgi:predicted nucleic acid-binding protein